MNQDNIHLKSIENFKVSLYKEIEIKNQTLYSIVINDTFKIDDNLHTFQWYENLTNAYNWLIENEFIPEIKHKITDYNQDHEMHLIDNSYEIIMLLNYIGYPGINDYGCLLVKTYNGDYTCILAGENSISFDYYLLDDLSYLIP